MAAMATPGHALDRIPCRAVPGPPRRLEVARCGDMAEPNWTDQERIQTKSPFLVIIGQPNSVRFLACATHTLRRFVGVTHEYADYRTARKGGAKSRLGTKLPSARCADLRADLPRCALPTTSRPRCGHKPRLGLSPGRPATIPTRQNNEARSRTSGNICAATNSLSQSSTTMTTSSTKPCSAWNFLANDLDRVASITARSWATVTS
jgi:hypothetical protein